MYTILLLPLLSGLIAQTLKYLIRTNKKKFGIKHLMAYSGMPSAHSALIISLATIMGLELGPDSPPFAISTILAIIVIRDALGIRRYLGLHGKTLNVLVKDLSNDNILEEEYPRLLEHIGHTPLQVIVGALIGFSVSLAGYLIF